MIRLFRVGQLTQCNVSICLKPPPPFVSHCQHSTNPADIICEQPLKCLQNIKTEKHIIENQSKQKQ